MGTGAETFPHCPSQVVDPVDDLPGMMPEHFHGQMAGPGIGMATRLGQARTGEQVAGTGD